MNEFEESDINLKETLELQMSEVEMLQSMYPNPGEFKLDNAQQTLAEIQSFLDDKIRAQYLESRIGFTVAISSGKKQSAELVCHLPHEYPRMRPELFLRAPNLIRESQTQLNEDLNEFMTSLDCGEICIGSIIDWLRENIHHYTSQETPVQHEKKTASRIDTVFTRLWIYSHHIYSKFKRRDILEWGSELKLTGFCMPGKPGVVCIEGYSSEVDEFWYRLRRLNWKKIAIREKEDSEIGKKNIKSLRKFSPFEEIGFDVRSGKGREYHMDLGKFYEYLKEHQCRNIFQLYFGVEGKAGPAE